MDIRSLIFILGATPLGLLFVISLQPLNRRTDRQWAIPAWAQNPFNIKQPLQFFHFAAFFFLATGFASVARLIITGPEYLYESLVPLAVGAGLLIGLYLSTVLYRSRMESPVHH